MEQAVPLFLREDLDSTVSKYSDPDQRLIREFSKQGFVVIELKVDGLLDEVIHQVQYAADAKRVQDAWRHSKSVRSLALNEEVERVLGLLYGREPFAFQTLNFPVGTQQFTHSDTLHFSSMPADYMAGVWVALEDIDAENGPLHYYPGSHRLPHVTMESLGTSGWGVKGYELFSSHYAPEIERRTHGMRKCEAHLKKGQALIWAANLLHGGNPILDNSRSRHSQVTHYYFRGCRYWTPLQSGEGKKRMRCPYNISTGKTVTRLGELKAHPGIARLIPGLA